MRRIEAVSGSEAFSYLLSKSNDLEALQNTLGLGKNATAKESLGQIEKLNDEIKNLKKKLKSGLSQTPTETVIVSSKYGDMKLCISHLESMERNDLREASDKARDKMKDKGLCVFTAGKTEKGFPILISVTKSFQDLKAGELLKEVTKIHGGKGGGRPDFAQGTVDQIQDLDKTIIDLLT